MKLRSKYIRISIIGLFMTAVFSTPLFSEISGLSNSSGFFIPSQGSVSTFEFIKIDEGSGEYYFFDQDQSNFFRNWGRDLIDPSASILKYKSKSRFDFFHINFNTIWKPKVPCSDLLSDFSQKPPELEFISCEKTRNNGQIIAEAKYRVCGKKSKIVEDFLVKTYGMGNLKWVCCGWETGGKFGVFEHPGFKKIDPDCIALIDMYGSVEFSDENKSTELQSEIDRNKIDYFTVVVQLAIV